ncbi:MAG: ABC transporter ATP-binding protein [Treponema sp.]|nr:ABC transporter ATP-binding protein [Treponema sp.]
MIELISMTKKYKNFIAVDNASFKIHSGKITGLLGVNGAGKSTILKILATLSYPTDGKVFIDNIDCIENPIEAKKIVGYVSENPLFYENFSCKDFLKFVCNVRDIDTKNIEKISNKCSLEEVLQKKISTLSKGYRQRLAFAQAILHNPKVLILDEATDGLDAKQNQQIKKIIFENAKNKTIIFSSHIMSEIENICDDVIIIHNGKILEQDTISNLCEKTKCQNLEQAFLKITENFNSIKQRSAK